MSTELLGRHPRAPGRARLSAVRAECLSQSLRRDVEVLVVSDGPLAGFPEGVRHVETGSATDTSPAEKRDYAFPHATGDVLAYIDDDAYPAPDWLETAARHFDDSSVHALGGPGVTPPELAVARASRRLRVRVAGRQRDAAVSLPPGPAANGRRLPRVQLLRSP